jgi:hypothetical protein
MNLPNARKPEVAAWIATGCLVISLVVQVAMGLQPIGERAAIDHSRIDRIAARLQRVEEDTRTLRERDQRIMSDLDWIKTALRASDITPSVSNASE